jgi:hypothetical protein
MLVLFVMSVTAHAADVGGTWTGSVAFSGGDVPAVPVTFNFKADGGKLTGSTLTPEGLTLPIRDGKIEGSTITFYVTYPFGAMSINLPYKGVVSSDQIKMSADMGTAFGLAPVEFVLKKTK